MSLIILAKIVQIFVKLGSFVLQYLCMENIDLYKISQTHKVLTLDKSSNMLNHSYLITSKDELFLDIIGLHAVKDLYCEDKDSPCNNCVSCNKIEHSNMVDFETYPNGNKSLVVEDIVNIINSAQVRPMESKFKVFLLKNFDECTVQGQNKLLKTLEEPPQNVVFILLVKNIGMVLPTILSRTKKITEPVLKREIIDKYLKDKHVINSELVASMSDGLLTTAMKIAENKDADKILSLCLDLLKNFRSTKDLLNFSSKILALKQDIPFFLETLSSLLRDISVYGKSNNLYFKNLENEYKILSVNYAPIILEKIILKINEINKKTQFNCNMTGVIDQFLLDILEVKFLCQK